MPKLTSTDELPIMGEPKKINTEDLHRWYKKEGGKLGYEQFKSIIATFNYAVSQRVNEGYLFVLPHHLGTIKVIENKRKVKLSKRGDGVVAAVDWGTSNKIKAEILSRGGLPYREENGVGNGGEKWLVYHTSPVYYTIIRVVDLQLKNHSLYEFKPTWHNQRGLQKIIDENSSLLFKQGEVNHRDRVKKFRLRFTKRDEEYAAITDGLM
jgi:hypothetical protein